MVIADIVQNLTDQEMTNWIIELYMGWTSPYIHLKTICNISHQIPAFVVEFSTWSFVSVRIT